MIRILFLSIVLVLFSTSAFSTEGGGDITFKLTSADPVHFSHDFHLKSRGIKCVACHSQLFADAGGSYKMKKEKMTKQNFCSHCHNGMKSFDTQSAKNCSRCHKK